MAEDRALFSLIPTECAMKSQRIHLLLVEDDDDTRDLTNDINYRVRGVVTFERRCIKQDGTVAQEMKATLKALALYEEFKELKK